MVELLVLMVVLLSTLLYSIFKSSWPANVLASLTIDRNDLLLLLLLLLLLASFIKKKMKEEIVAQYAENATQVAR